MRLTKADPGLVSFGLLFYEIQLMAFLLFLPHPLSIYWQTLGNPVNGGPSIIIIITSQLLCGELLK